VNEDLHYVHWPAGAGRPAVLRRADVAAAVASGKPFARKFDTEVDEGALDLVDARIERIESGVAPA
jgi:hypothetical protein